MLRENARRARSARLLVGSTHTQIDDDIPVVCLATPHPAKFPDVIAKALELKEGSHLTEAAAHPDLVRVLENEANLSICVLDDLEKYLAEAIGYVGSNTSEKAK